MAIARKCDRCGKCFDPYHTKGDMCRFKNPVLQNSESLKEMRTSGFLYGDLGPDVWVDLCPACSKAFIIFMNGGEKTTELYKDLMDVLREIAAYGEEGKTDD